MAASEVDRQVQDRISPSDCDSLHMLGNSGDALWNLLPGPLATVTDLGVGSRMTQSYSSPAARTNARVPLRETRAAACR